MPLTETDRQWFRAHPDREYRLRRQTSMELQRWPVSPREGFTGLCIIRADDGVMRCFALAAGESWCDCDGCLEDFFGWLGEKAA